MKGDGRGLV